MQITNFKKEPWILIIFGFLIVFMLMVCDNGSNSRSDSDAPEKPALEEPETPWVAGKVTIDIFSFNDFHGTVDNKASDSNPGAARFSAIVKHLMFQSEHSILLAAGDNYQGSPLSNYFNGEPVSRMLKELGLKYSVIGNHEWDWGSDKIPRFAGDGNITFITANLFLKGTDNRPDFCYPYVIANRAGRRIGIIGLTLVETPDLVFSNLIEGYEFREPGDWLKSMVDDLRDKFNCDAVIALTHMGSFGNGASVSGGATQLAHNNMGFDAIISAHTHQSVSGTANGVPVIQADHNGRALGKVSLEFNDHNLVNVSAGLISKLTETDIYPPDMVDGAVAAIVDEYDNIIAPTMNEVIGVFGDAKTVGKNAWANQLVFDYIVRKAGPGWENVVLLQTPGDWRTVTLGDPNDNVTVGFMWTLMPFDNSIYLLRLRGDHLIRLMRGQSLSGGTTFASPVVTNAGGSGSNWIITSLNEKIETNKYYKVSMSDYMFTGGDGFGVEGNVDYDPSPQAMGILLRDAMIDEMKWRKEN